jgi:hypothetical protein
MPFFNYSLSQMIEPDNLLVKVESIVDWSEVTTLLDRKLGAKVQRFHILMLFKSYVHSYKL